MAILAPFETFAQHAERERSGEPYNDNFIKRCRDAALRYDNGDADLRRILLSELKKCVPFHRRAEVFAALGEGE
jgi:hypothetical protein